MHQISFNTNHDFAPSVLANGQIVFSRWEVDQRHGSDQPVSCQSGRHGPAALLRRQQPRDRRQHRRHQQQRHSVPERAPARGRQAARHRPAVSGHAARRRHRAASMPRTSSKSISRARPPAHGRDRDRPSATTLGVTTDANMPSAGGRFVSMYPLYDGTNRMLVSWAPCLVQNTGRHHRGVQHRQYHAAPTCMLAPPQYTMWIYDFDAGTLSPLLERRCRHRDRRAGHLAGAHAPSRRSSRISRRPPPAAAEPWSTTRSACSTSAASTISTASIRRSPSIATQAESQPGELLHAAGALRPHREGGRDSRQDGAQDRSASAFGPAGMGMREILGYAPVQPDGSVQIQVPAQRAVHHRRARRECAAHHRAAHELDAAACPGETKSCNGCHTRAMRPIRPRTAAPG